MSEGKTRTKPRIPLEVDGIQLNYCKNPQCSNFGIPASTQSQKKKGVSRDGYTLIGSGKNYPLLKCHQCGEFPPVKSNEAIAAERKRLRAYLYKRPGYSCPNLDCDNHGFSLNEHPSHYRSFGKTRSGSQRYLCKGCKKTFSVGKSTLRQKQPHKNKLIFKLLVNKSPFRRILDITDIHPQTLYDKIDFIHQQCLSFVADKERQLLEGCGVKRLYLSVDRQDYLVNWSQREDKRNVQLSAVATADNATGYVFGMHLNYDPDAEYNQISHELGGLEGPHRKHAGLWLPSDYQAAIARQKKRATRTDGAVEHEVDAAYQEVLDRDDVEVSEQQDSNLALPTKGMQVHSEYTLYDHFMLMAELFQHVEKVRFFLDQDSGMRAACLAAFCDRIKARTTDAFYVRINKELTVDEKRRYLQTAKGKFEQERKKHPDLMENEVKLHLIKEKIANMKAHGKWKDRWMLHPFPNMSEPEKAVCYLTDMEDYDPDHMAWLYNKASLHGVDRYFMQIRRRISMLERPIHSASKTGRVWHGYSAYNPAMITKMLDIFRVYYNYIQMGRNKNTPAQRLGLANKTNKIEDIMM